MKAMSGRICGECGRASAQYPCPYCRPAVMLDKNGYPTDETIRKLERWEYPFHGIVSVLEIIFQDYGNVSLEDRQLILATGGWSGCEEAVCALDNNMLFHAFCWQMSKRGGYHEYTLPKDCNPYGEIGHPAGVDYTD